MCSSFFWFCHFSDKLRVQSLSSSGWLHNPTDGGLLCLWTTTRWQQEALRLCSTEVLKQQRWWKDFILLHVENCVRLGYVINDIQIHKTHCDVLWDTQRHSPSLLHGRWSVQLSPTGHKLLVLGSSLADSWQESRRKFLCWSFRSRSPTPPSSAFFGDTLTPLWLGRVGRLVMREEQQPCHLEDTQRGAYLIGGDVCWC